MDAISPPRHGNPSPGMGSPCPGMGNPCPGMDRPSPGVDSPCPGMDSPCPGVHFPCPGMDFPCPGMDSPCHERVYARRTYRRVAAKEGPCFIGNALELPPSMVGTTRTACLDPQWHADISPRTRI